MISETFQLGEFALALREVHASDAHAVIGLHRLVFGPEADHPWFAWKYGTSSGQGHGQAMGVWHGDSLIAYCGGLPRVMWQQGKQRNGLQIGDVMVHPGWRGILGRSGPFFRVSKWFYDSRLGPLDGHDFQLGFGFPNERHLRLAVVLGLLQDAGDIQTLHWPAEISASTALAWHWHWQELEANSPRLVQATNNAWQAMQAQGTHLTLGERNATYLQWRYVHRPAAPSAAGTAPRYRFFGLRRRWSARYAGVAVMDLRSSSAHWLDWIGPPSLMPLAVKACRLQAALAGASELTAWASAEVAAQLADSGVTQREVCAKLAIPSASDLEPAAIGQLRFWWMGGDTDFL